MKYQLIKGLVVLSLGLTATTASAFTYDLCVGATTITMPPNSDFPAGEPVPVWGYGLEDNTTGCDSASVPGPALTIPVGDTLTVNLRNTLTGAGAEDVSIVIPGQDLPKVAVAGVQHQSVLFDPGDGRMRLRSFVGEAAVGGLPVQYHWDNLQAGTYLYQSASHVQIQVSMGLYGALTNDSSAGVVYPGEAYDQQVSLLYSEVDPALNNAVNNGTYTSCSTGFVACNGELANGSTPSAINYNPVYYMVNGEPFTSKLQAAHSIGGIPSAGTSSDVLIRFLNAGNETHVPVIQGAGARWRVISENGEPYSYASNNAKTQHSLTVPAMTTRDVILSIGNNVTDTTQVSTPTAFAIYDRALAVTNAVDEVPGGLISFVIADLDTDGDGVFNYQDNCVLKANPNQDDTDNAGAGDGYGDVCDGDLDGNGTVNFGDINVMFGLLGTTGSLADFDGNGNVNFGDINVMFGLLGQPIGPSCIVAGADPILCPFQ